MFCNDLISVIVPIYKVEKYLHKCVDSIINQTYNNLEIILVDDGSPDNCGKICDGYAQKDRRIKVIHKKNGGLSDARNAGMKIATGDYVSFIDSDDYVSENFIEILYNVSVKENSDVVECNLVKFYENESINIVDDSINVETYKTEDALSMLIQENQFHQHVWNKLYKAEIALKIPFEKGKLNEDEFWTYQIFGQAKKISKVNEKMYFYLQRETSIMGNSFSFRRLDALYAKCLRQEYIEKFFPNLSNIARIDFFGTCIFMCQAAMKFLPREDKKKAKKIIKQYVKKCKSGQMSLSTIQHKKTHFWFSFAEKSFILCCKVRSIIGIGF